MNRLSFLLGAAPAIAVLAACGNVAVDGAPGGSTNGVTASSSTTSSTCGATSSTSSSSSGAPCAGGSFVHLESCGLVSATFRAACATSYNPTMWGEALGYLVEPAFPPPGGASSNLDVDGCATNGPASQGLALIAVNATGPGAFSDVDAAYQDGMGHTWAAMGGSVTLTVQQLDPVGGAIGGGFEGTLFADGNPTPASVTGTFQVCHTKDAK